MTEDVPLLFWQQCVLVATPAVGVMLGTAIGWFLFWRPWLRRLEERRHD